MKKKRNTRHKKNAYLHFSVQDDLNRFFQLVEDADVYVNGYAPGRLQEKFGITEEKLLSINPNLNIVTSSAFGEVGPWGKRHGWENIAQAPVGSSFDHRLRARQTQDLAGIISGDINTMAFQTLHVVEKPR